MSIETGPIVVAKALLLDTEGQALVLERAMTDRHRPGGVDLPGGSADRDANGAPENPMTTVLREVFEEAGIRLQPDDLKEAAVLTDTRESDGREFRRHLYIGHLATQATETGVATDPKEHRRHWWTPHEALEVILEGTHWVRGIRLARQHGHLTRPRVTKV